MAAADTLNFDPEPVMEKAIDLALAAQYQTDPNPVVGAVLVDADGNVISEGYHEKAGEPHAEVIALKPFSKVPENSILFVTLEPCSHFGKTPPCVDLILEKGVTSVVVGCRDPNPEVSGKGIRKLKDNGVRVFTGVCQDRCTSINKVFNKHIVQKLPFVVIKSAASLDGKIAMPSGESKWITDEQARNFGHLLRSRFQAMAVGGDTLKSDNPQLTDRVSGSPRQPVRVVFSSRGDIPERSHFAVRKDVSRYLIAGSRIRKSTAAQLEKRGINVLVAATQIPDIRWALENLYNNGICSLLVEGGAKLISSFIREGMADELYLFLSGKIIGNPKAPAWSGDMGIENLAEAFRVEFDEFEKIGRDILIKGTFQK